MFSRFIFTSLAGPNIALFNILWYFFSNLDEEFCRNKKIYNRTILTVNWRNFVHISFLSVKLSITFSWFNVNVLRNLPWRHMQIQNRVSRRILIGSSMLYSICVRGEVVGIANVDGDCTLFGNVSLCLNSLYESMDDVSN